MGKPCFTAVGTLKTRYASTFEYMFVFSKGKPKTFNPIKDRKNIHAGKKKHGTIRQKGGSTVPVSSIGKRYSEFGQRFYVQSRKVADLGEFWRGQKHIVLLDPNILACKERMDLLDQLVNSGSVVDFTQGLDIRLTNEAVAVKLSQMRVKRLHFAWDNAEQDLSPYFRRFSEWYSRKCCSGKVVYVLTNFNSTMEQNLYRIYTLRDMGYDPYVMVYDKPHASRKIRDLQRWVNNRVIFRKCRRFEDYRR